MNDYTIDDIIKSIKKIEKELLSSSEYKKKIRDAIDEAIENDQLFLEPGYDDEYAKNKSKLPRLVAEKFEADIIIILDESQDVNIVCSFIVDDIATKLREEYGHKYYFGTGDGDEGCIYLD